MAPYGVSVSYVIPFRGQSETTSMVFHYDPGVGFEDWEELGDAVVAQVRNVLPIAREVTQVRVWGPTDQGQAASVTRLIKDVSLAGLFSTTGGSMYPELAYYVSMFLGRNPATGRKRFLRKWIHAGQKLHGSGAVVDAELLPAETLAFLTTWFEGCKNLTVGTYSPSICAPNGDHLPLGTVAIPGNRLHIRQLKQ